VSALPIEQLVAYRKELAERIDALDRLIVLESPAAAPQIPTPSLGVQPRLERTAARAKAPRGKKPSVPREHKVRAGGKFKIRDAVRLVCETLKAPFDAPAVIAAAVERWPEKAQQIERASIATVLLQLAQAGELDRDAGTRPARYTRTAKLGVPTMSAKEEAYRRLRAEIPTGGGE
jgi:hypothetical protein